MTENKLPEVTPKLKEIALPTAEELARKAYLMHFGKDAFDKVEIKEQDFILQWLDWGLAILRPFITPASSPGKLSNYLQHIEGCAATVSYSRTGTPSGKCSCGLDELLSSPSVPLLDVENGTK